MLVTIQKGSYFSRIKSFSERLFYQIVYFILINVFGPLQPAKPAKNVGFSSSRSGFGNMLRDAYNFLDGRIDDLSSDLRGYLYTDVRDAVLRVIPYFARANKAAFTEGNLETVLKMMMHSNSNVRQAALKIIPYFVQANKAAFTEGNLETVLDMPQNEPTEKAVYDADGKRLWHVLDSVHSSPISKRTFPVREVIPYFVQANKAAFTAENLGTVLYMMMDSNSNVREAALEIIPYFVQANKAAFTTSNWGILLQMLSDGRDRDVYKMVIAVIPYFEQASKVVLPPMYRGDDAASRRRVADAIRPRLEADKVYVATTYFGSLIWTMAQTFDPVFKRPDEGISSKDKKKKILQEIAKFLQADKAHASAVNLKMALTLLDEENSSLRKAGLEVISYFMQANKAAFTSSNLRKLRTLLQHSDSGVRKAARRAERYFVMAERPEARQESGEAEVSPKADEAREFEEALGNYVKEEWLNKKRESYTLAEFQKEFGDGTKWGKRDDELYEALGALEQKDNRIMDAGGKFWFALHSEVTETGEPTGNLVTFGYMHQNGNRHAGAHVFAVTQDPSDGQVYIVLQIRAKGLPDAMKDERYDAAVTGHGGLIGKAAGRAQAEFTDETGIEDFDGSRFVAVADTTHNRPLWIKEGSSDFTGVAGYDDSGIYHSISKEKDNKEVNHVFAVGLSWEEAQGLKKPSQKREDEVGGFTLVTPEQLIGLYEKDRKKLASGLTAYLDPKVRTNFMAAVAKGIRPTPHRFDVTLRLPGLGDLLVNARSGGRSSIDFTMAPDGDVPTKKHAIEDFLKSNGFEGKDGLYFGNQNEDINERDAIVAQIPGMQVIAVDEDPRRVTKHPRIRNAMKDGIEKPGLEGTLAELEALLQPGATIENKKLPKFVALDIDDTVLLNPSLARTPAIDALEQKIFDAIIQLRTRGVVVAIISDNDTKITADRVVRPLLGLAAQPQYGLTGDERAITFYTSGMATKFIARGAEETEREFDRAYGEKYRMPKTLSDALLEILGEARENDQGIMEGSGVLWDDYYLKITEVDELNKRRLKPELAAQFDRYKPQVTPAGNFEPQKPQERDPLVVDGQKTVAQITARPILARRLSSRPNDVPVPDLRESVMIRIIEELNKKLGTIVTNTNNPGLLPSALRPEARSEAVAEPAQPVTFDDFLAMQDTRERRSRALAELDPRYQPRMDAARAAQEFEFELTKLQQFAESEQQYREMQQQMAAFDIKIEDKVDEWIDDVIPQYFDSKGVALASADQLAAFSQAAFADDTFIEIIEWHDEFMGKGNDGLMSRIKYVYEKAEMGRIVLFSSMAARTGGKNVAHYAASKGGILGLTRALAVEAAADNIRVNAISPVITDTPMPRAVVSDEYMESRKHHIPLGRIGNVQDMVEAAMFLLSDDSSYIVGQDLRVNGGSTLW